MPGLQSIEGIISNLKTTDIVNAMIALERRPVTLMESQQATKTNEITSFKALSAKLLALKTTLAKLRSESDFSQAAISISDDKLLSATAKKAVPSGTYAINILSLARNHQIASQGFDDATTNDFGIGTITISLGSRSATTINIEAGKNSLSEIARAINDARAGIQATVINDGSASNPMRLILTGEETGARNQISVTSSLSGGHNLNFATASFDNPETINLSGQTTSLFSLGSTAGYTGSANKNFTFTVQGSGPQTIGQGNITINWSDGTNTGAIVVSQADTEIVGPEGLKLMFSDGVLAGGDSFRVQSFAPLLQRATDAKITLGSNENGATPITVESTSNTIKDAIPGLTLEVKGVTTDTTGPVTIKTGINTDNVKKTITEFINAYNDVMSFVDDQNKFNPETKEGGTLLGDLTLTSIQSRLSTLMTSPVAGLVEGFNTLSAVGIRTGQSGRLALRDSTKLTEALEKDMAAVLRLFTDSGEASLSGISLIGGAANIKGNSTLRVDITQAATKGYLQGLRFASPAVQNLTLSDTNNRLRLRVDGFVSDEIVLTPKQYASGAELAAEIQTRINSDSKIGSRGVTVEWVELGGEGFLKFSSSSYGATSKVEVMENVTNPAYAALGLSGAAIVTGFDVAGTINGEKATGSGQLLTGDAKNTITAGLQLLVTLAANQVVSGEEGSIRITRGFASSLDAMLDGMTKTGGILDRKTSALEKQISAIKTQIAEFDKRLEKRRESLFKRFNDLETTLGNLQSQGSFLTAQLENIQANLGQMLGNK